MSLVQSRLPLKHLHVQRLKESIQKSAGWLVIQAPDWADPDWAPLKERIQSHGAKPRHVKNTLMRLACEQGPFKAMMPVFNGPNTVIFFPTPAAGVAVANELLKQTHCVVLAGALGRTILDIDGVRALAKVDPLDKTMQQIVSVLQGPPASLAAVLDSPLRAVFSVTQRYADSGAQEKSQKKEEGGEGAPAAPASS